MAALLFHERKAPFDAVNDVELSVILLRTDLGGEGNGAMAGRCMP